MKTIAITIGDVNGIGPEVLLKALQKWRIPENIKILLIGPAFHLNFWQKHLTLEIPNFQIKRSCRHSTNSNIAIYDNVYEQAELDIGRWTAHSGKIAGRALEEATKLARDNKVQAIVTAPVSKKALSTAGFHYPGQTEFLAESLATKSFAMMMISGHFRIALVTTHMPLSQVAMSLDQKKILGKLRVISNDLKERFNITTPKIAVTGLNPHAGEDGLLGNEENDIIIPAILQAHTENIDAHGPFSADALFGLQAKYFNREQQDNPKKFDAYLVMYHDQGLIPLKMYAFGKAVNYTAGLPVVRTSPDHGTAYDIAGKGIADPTSMIEALQFAVDIIT